MESKFLYGFLRLDFRAFVLNGAKNGIWAKIKTYLEKTGYYNLHPFGGRWQLTLVGFSCRLM